MYDDVYGTLERFIRMASSKTLTATSPVMFPPQCAAGLGMDNNEGFLSF